MQVVHGQHLEKAWNVTETLKRGNGSLSASQGATTSDYS